MATLLTNPVYLAQRVASLRAVPAKSWNQRIELARTTLDLCSCYDSEADYRANRRRSADVTPQPQPAPKPLPPPVIAPAPAPEPPPKPKPQMMSAAPIPTYISPKEWKTNILPIWDTLSSAEQMDIIQNNPHLVG